MATLQRWAVLAILAAAAVVGVTGCEVPETATGLHPEGPPKFRQVFMTELYEENMQLRSRSILAYGTHPDIPDEREHATTTAAANTQTIRLVFDEILRGNALEEIRCRTRQLSDVDACVVPGSYSRVPVGATPDDIADCAVANDLLADSCSGPMAVCLNEDGIPCGVDDEDENGSADNSRLIAGQVRIVCGDIEVPLDVEQSYWQPAGNQLVPARQTPEGSLGPALVLRPQNAGRMPTGSTCRVVLAPDVVDKDDIQPCTPPGGDPTAECTPGDLSGFSFGTEQLRITSSTPEHNMTGVAVDLTPFRIFWNAPLLPSSVTPANVTVTPALPAMTVSLQSMDTQIQINTGGNLMPATTYTITISGVSDSFGVALAQPVTITFTTI